MSLPSSQAQARAADNRSEAGTWVIVRAENRGSGDWLRPVPVHSQLTELGSMNLGDLRLQTWGWFASIEDGRELVGLVCVGRRR
jgi:hypothetical protein